MRVVDLVPVVHRLVRMGGIAGCRSRGRRLLVLGVRSGWSRGAGFPGEDVGVPTREFGHRIVGLAPAGRGCFRGGRGQSDICLLDTSDAADEMK